MRSTSGRTPHRETGRSESTGWHEDRRRLRAAVIALVLAVVVVGALGAWQVTAARDSQRTQIVNGELTAARLASSAVASGISSRLQLVSNLAAAERDRKTITDDSSATSRSWRTGPRPLSRVREPRGRLRERRAARGLACECGAVVGTRRVEQAGLRRRAQDGAPYVSQALRLSGRGPLVIGLAAPFFSGGNPRRRDRLHDPSQQLRFDHRVDGTAERRVDRRCSTRRDAPSPARRPPQGRPMHALRPASKALHGIEGTGTESCPASPAAASSPYTPVPHLGLGDPRRAADVGAERSDRHPHCPPGAHRRAGRPDRGGDGRAARPAARSAREESVTRRPR